MRRTILLVTAGLVVTAGAGIAWASIPDADGVIHGCYRESGGVLRIIDDEVTGCRAGETPIQWNQTGPAGPGAVLGYYMHAQDAEIPIPYPDMEVQLQLDAPDPGEGGGYLGSATFDLVNYGPVDAAVNCAVGTQMGHELMVPVSQLSDPSLGELGHSSISTYTITGVSNGMGTWLVCHLVGWVGQDGDYPDPPDVRLRRGSLQAIYVPDLEIPSP